MYSTSRLLRPERPMCVHLYLGIKCPYIVIMLSAAPCHFKLDVLNLLACRRLMNNLVQCSHFLSEALRCVYNRHTWLQLNKASNIQTLTDFCNIQETKLSTHAKYLARMIYSKPGSRMIYSKPASSQVVFSQHSACQNTGLCCVLVQWKMWA